ncbi:cytochrome c oxidase subunit II [Aurantimonas sp. Leaf443]|uniref:cytochrome c oxidase subunit II n=1 Tax=Aurantimonas sp. Leaf443 TaxID=1736378 RepID=UPI0006F36318|nr:cytochrome c oxidase subunit II [Aurantimonas sp. Leaf443]KQT85473.1 cytochrome B [Aurantimonas sp. Leaf443]
MQPERRDPRSRPPGRGRAARLSGRRASACLPGLSLLALSACAGPQSTLTDAGTESAAVAWLFWIMLAGAVVIWLLVMGLSVYATKINPAAHSEKTGLRLIAWGGVVFPTVVLAVLIVWGLEKMPEFRGEGEGPKIAVSGERFWWRVAYGVEGEPGVVKSLPAGGVESANELWLPVGRRTEILLGSPDVIHSFWVPSIAGKTDTIPGRVNRIVLEPTREGVYNGVCAEFCGEAHAQMAFRVIVVPPAEYEAYVARQAQGAAVPQGPGFDAFMKNGCNACHSVRGTPAAGQIGPDLTHVGSRKTIGAGTLPLSAQNLSQFIAVTEHVKQGVEMPSYSMLPASEIDAMAQWLEGLK